MSRPSLLSQQIAEILEREPPVLHPLHGGMIGEVYRAEWDGRGDGGALVVKVDDGPQPQLDIEGMMLRYLAEESALPVPHVHHSSPRLLIMDYVSGRSRFNAASERHAANLLAALHAVHAPACGLDQNTLIGALHQPNPWTASWVEFFAEQRLLYLGRLAVERGRMPISLLRRVEALSHRLGDLIDEPAQPSLVHGDIWASNVLADDDRITAFLDPAIYYGHPEVELAYILLFHTFGEPFLRRYEELRPLTPGFFETRIHVYQLYPLLSHVCHFGGGYVESTARALGRVGF